MVINYQLKFQSGLNQQEEIYSFKYHSKALAAVKLMADILKENRFVLIESEFKKGRFVGEIEYGVNPPHWSGNKIEPREAEVYLREVRGDIDFTKSKIFQNISGSKN